MKNWDKPVLNGLISLLNKQSIVSDEDSTGLSSTMIEKWNSDCCLFLSQNGYKGGSLSKQGGFFKGHGAVYVIYDPDNVSYAEAQNYIQNIAGCN